MCILQTITVSASLSGWLVQWWIVQKYTCFVLCLIWVSDSNSGIGRCHHNMAFLYIFGCLPLIYTILINANECNSKWAWHNNIYYIIFRYVTKITKQKILKRKRGWFLLALPSLCCANMTWPMSLYLFIFKNYTIWWFLWVVRVCIIHHPIYLFLILFINLAFISFY